MNVAEHSAKREKRGREPLVMAIAGVLQLIESDKVNFLFIPSYELVTIGVKPILTQNKIVDILGLLPNISINSIVLPTASSSSSNGWFYGQHELVARCKLII